MPAVPAKTKPLPPIAAPPLVLPVEIVNEPVASGVEDRLTEFMDPARWQRSKKGNATRMVGDQRLTIYWQWGLGGSRSGFLFSVHGPGGARHYGRDKFDDPVDAQRDAFGWLEEQGADE